MPQTIAIDQQGSVIDNLRVIQHAGLNRFLDGMKFAAIRFKLRYVALPSKSLGLDRMVTQYAPHKTERLFITDRLGSRLV